MQTGAEITSQNQLSANTSQGLQGNHLRSQGIEQLLLAQPSQGNDGVFPRNVEQPRALGQTLIVDETKHYMEGFIPDDDDSDGEPDIKMGRLDAKALARQKKTRGRVKIKMEFIQNKLRRYTTFSKRKTGIMKKAYELSTLTGTQVMLLVASETGHVYTFATRKLQPMITSESGKALIQTCLNSPDPAPLTTQTNPNDQRMSQTGYEETDLQYTTAEEEAKANISNSMTGGSITNSIITHGQPSFPLTTYVAPSNNQVNSKGASVPVTYSVQTVAGGSLTAIFTPSPAQAVQVQQTPTQPSTQPSNAQTQVLSGQLHLHRIHPQNIVLTGNNPPVQPGHIIINQQPGVGGIPVVIADSGQVNNSSFTAHGSAIQPPASGQDNIITILPNSEMPSGTAVQMVYNSNGNILYASPNVIHTDGQVANQVNSESGITVHHQGELHTVTAGVLEQSTNDSLHQIVNGSIVNNTADPNHDAR